MKEIRDTLINFLKFCELLLLAQLLLFSNMVAAQTNLPTNIVVNGLDKDPATSIQPNTDALNGGTRYTIGEAQGFRPGGNTGVNLLQSLQTFDLNSADTALFTAGLPTDNIIARVTGGEVSDIWGQISMNVPNANLFLLNPAGFMFGATASLNIDGGFHASTADDLRMIDELGNQLVAFSGDSALAMAQPAAFGFVNAPMGKITVSESKLNASASGGLSLVGGEVTLKDGAEITGNGPQVELVSAAQAGDVSILTIAPNGLTLALDEADPGGNIQLLNSSKLVISGGGIDITAATVSVQDNSAISANPTDDGPPANIVITAPTQPASSILTLSDGGTINTNVRDPFANGPFIAGDIRIENFGEIRLSEKSIISSDIGEGAFGEDAIATMGDISIINAGEVELTTQSQIRSDSYGGGGISGNVKIDTQKLSLAGRSEISTGVFVGANSNLGPEETPGSVFITTDAIDLRDGGSIESISVMAGDGGDIHINTRILTP